MILLHTGPAVTRWVARQLDPTADESYFANATSIGVLRDGVPVAGAVYSQFRSMPNGHDVMVSIAAVPGVQWATRGVLKAMCRYPFEQLGCTRATALVAENNVASIRFCKKMGFRREGVVRRGWNGKTNGILFGLLREECKYI